MSTSCSIEATVINRLGMHARPAMMFVDLAGTFPCQIKVKRGDLEVDGKSIMQVMMLAASQGSVLVISAEGQDAEKAAHALKKLVDAGFDEE